MKARAWCVGVLLALVAGGATADPSVTVDRVQQRYPWNGLVDIDYTVVGLPDDASNDWSVSLQMTADGEAVSNPTFLGCAS